MGWFIYSLLVIVLFLGLIIYKAINNTININNFVDVLNDIVCPIFFVVCSLRILVSCIEKK